MTVARLAVQPAPSKAMRTSTSSTTTTTITANDSIDPKATLRLTSSPSPNDKGKGSPTSLASSTATAVSQRPSSSTAEQQELPLFTPIWDYDRFPIGPCVRENNRSSQEHENPFLMLEYHQQNHRPQSNGRPNPNTAQMMRSGSSSSSASASSATSLQQQKNCSKQSSSRSSSSSRHGSRKNLHINVLGKSLSNGNGVSEFLPGASSSAPPSPSLNVADPSISPDLLFFFQPPFNGGGDHHHLADLDQEPNTAKPTTSATAPPAAPVPTSKFDLYKAQMDRVRSSHRLHGRSASASVSVSSSSPTTTVKGGLPFPSTPSSSVYSPPSTSSPTTIYTPSASSSVADSFVASSNTISKKGHHQHTIFPKLFKKPSLSKSSRIRNLPTAQPPTPAATATPSIANSNNHSRDGSRASLSLSRRESRSIEHPQFQNQQLLQRSPIEEQQDRWREEWLRPSGAIHSMFRDGPSKFNCPHCGAMKVVSNIQYVPGLMSYLVAFGLMFLTLGTLSYLPFRKDHEGTKDCIHWCPECERKVARFNRANSTWEWI
ncbi:hypothetical protein K457DRAFT_139738 [Linnemannia elongata AG-77]|uniref:LITAF domain-containing protein n=1 Tax=Linnemannia elongata AG-77 TaxID=1314771 RepID=A0A197JPT5_9FUNG|nr:hypothetical protein K457DRAFT_139738 [Linnemannia elongata AG-77]